MNLALFGVSTRGGVNQPLARPGVRAHRDPGALGGHRCALPISIVIVGPVRNALNIWGVALILAQWRRIPHPVIPQQACVLREKTNTRRTMPWFHVGVDRSHKECVEGDISHSGFQ